MLKYNDEVGIIDHSDAIDPMSMLDGHISRMMGPFLESFNN
jgi:hypothetical protein